MAAAASISPHPSPAASSEKPKNGLAGLRQLGYDIPAGMVVSLISLPLSSGIAIASGMPPIYGLISAIIAGFVFPLIGGAYVTIAGPAAGLAPALLAIMATMGGAGDADHLGAGYHYLLVVIFMVGCVQIVLAALKLARFAAIIPVAVVEGMLAAIGLLIIVKQLPMFFGYTGPVHAHEFFEFLREGPHIVWHLTPAVFAVALSCLVLMLVLGSIKGVRFLKVVPPQLIAVVFGVGLGYALNLGSLPGGFLIKLPETPFHGVHLPDLAGMLARQDLWYAAILGVVTLTMIDGVESLATAMAIDRIDPFKRKSQPNRVLLAMGVCNIASSLVGGLTIIPGGVKSKANIAAGGRTLWANFTNAVCLVIYLLVAAPLINMIPKAALAAVLVYTGWKMCEPVIWRHMAHIGKEQLAIFAITVGATLLTDLLWGIFIGVAAKLALSFALSRRGVAMKPIAGTALPTWLQSVGDFFRNPVSRRELQSDGYHLFINKPLVCFNSMKLSEELERVPRDAKAVFVHLDECVSLVDHTSFENLEYVIQEFLQSDVPVQVVGLDRMRPLSHHHTCMHVVAPSLASA